MDEQAATWLPVEKVNRLSNYFVKVFVQPLLYGNFF
jgi:hypothetical protein